MSSRRKLLLNALGYALCVAPPLIAIFFCFPTWIRSGSAATMSGIAIVLCIVSALPFINRISGYMKSPSVFVAWLVVCVILTILRAIIDQMLLVSYVALISNTVGALVFKLRGSGGGKEQTVKEAQACADARSGVEAGDS